MATRDDLPERRDLVFPVLRAVIELKGSATSRQINEKALEEIDPTGEKSCVVYPAGSTKAGMSILWHHLDWTKHECKKNGYLEHPKQNLYLITQKGKQLASQSVQPRFAEETSASNATNEDTDSNADPIIEQHELSWSEHLSDDAPLADMEPQMLSRLHDMTSDAFEHFIVYLFRLFDIELEHVGGPGDGGVDAIGTAPISAIMSVPVAVQAKRNDPDSSIGREIVAQLQRDAGNQGAERAILVTLGRFSGPAIKAARETTPTVDLIDGERLCELILDKRVGIRSAVELDDTFFDRFEEL